MLNVGETAEEMLRRFRQTLAIKVEGVDSWANAYPHLPEENQIELLSSLDEADECELAIAALDLAITQMEALRLPPVRDELRQHRGC